MNDLNEKNDEIKYILAFHEIFNINLNRNFEKIYQYFGSFRDAWSCPHFLDEIGISERYRELFFNGKKTIVPERLVEECSRKGISLITR